MKPLLLIDVDGPLNSFGGPYSGGNAPDGYVLHRLRDRSFTDADGRPWVQGGLRVWLNPDHGPMLLALADRFELAWCTAWRESANELIAPVVGLPELPVVPLPDGWQTLTGTHWKWPGVRDYAAGRALAWFDDEFGPADFEHAEKRTDDGAPTLLVHIDPSHGIRQCDVDQVAEWADGLRLAAADELTRMDEGLIDRLEDADAEMTDRTGPDGILATLGEPGTVYAGPWTCPTCGTDVDHCGLCGHPFEDPDGEHERVCECGGGDE